MVNIGVKRLKPDFLTNCPSIKNLGITDNDIELIKRDMIKTFSSQIWT